MFEDVGLSPEQKTRRLSSPRKVKTFGEDSVTTTRNLLSMKKKNKNDSSFFKEFNDVTDGLNNTGPPPTGQTQAMPIEINRLDDLDKESNAKEELVKSTNQSQDKADIDDIVIP